MKQQALENMLKLFEQAVEDRGSYMDATTISIFNNLVTKSQILRSNERNQSVVRELINGHH